MSATYDGSVAAAVTGVFVFGTRAYDRYRKNKPSSVDERKQLADEWREYREAQDGRLATCEQEIRDLRAELGRRDTEITSLRSDLAERDRKIASLERRVTSQEHRDKE